MKRKELALILTLLTVTGCSFRPGNPIATQPSFKAVYFFQNEAQFSTENLKAYPEVVPVQTFNDLKKYANQKIALWIDKSATPFDTEKEKWLNEAPQAYYPIVLVGTSDTLHSFRDLLRLCCLMGPAGAYPGYDVPGFSVIQWKETHEPESPTTIFLQGYNQLPTVQVILEITNALLEGGLPATPATSPISGATATASP